MSNDDLPGLRISNGIYARARDLARELNLPSNATRSELLIALARSRTLMPSLPLAYDDTHDLEDVVRVIGPEGLKEPPKVGWKAVGPKLVLRKPVYTIKVRAVMCADSDGSHAVNITEAMLKDVFKAWSNLYFQSGLQFVLSERVVLKNTKINQDFTVPSGLDMTSPNPPMTDLARNTSFDEHNAARNAWARNYSGELVIFFRYGTKLSWDETAKMWTVGPASFAFSGPEHEFVAMGQGNSPEPTLLAHESGHYFHLGHTHGLLVSLTDAEEKLYPDWATNPAHRAARAQILRDRMAEGIRKFVDDEGHAPDLGLDVMDADGLSDTRPDPGPTIFDYEFGDRCVPGTITVQVKLTSGVRSYSVAGSPDIIMSYFFRCPGLKRFTELQIDRIRYVLETPVLTGTVKTEARNILPILSRHHLIGPSRRGDSGSQAGFVSEIAAARHNQRQIINAVRAQDGTLKLIAWNVAAGGEITRTGDSGNQAGIATSIAIARNTADSSFITACRNGSNRLFLISWNVNAGGTTITRLADSGTQAGTASLIRIVAPGSNRFVTACRASNDSLLLIVWRLNNDGSLTRLADSGSQAGAVSDIALVALSNTRVLTAVRAGDGTFKLISWSISNTAVTRLADSGSQAGEARIIRAVIDQAGHVVTAVKAGDNSLKLITWDVTGSGSINRLSDSGALAGETGEHDISMAGGRVITGVRAGDGHLKVILWQTANNGSITRVGDSANLADSASLITQCEELTGAPPIITSVRTTTNSLKLISWSTP